MSAVFTNYHKPQPFLLCKSIILFISSAGFVDMCVQHIPSPVGAAEVKVQSTYTGPLDDQLAEAMTECDAEVLYCRVW